MKHGRRTAMENKQSHLRAFLISPLVYIDICVRLFGLPCTHSTAQRSTYGVWGRDRWYVLVAGRHKAEGRVRAIARVRVRVMVRGRIRVRASIIDMNGESTAK